MEVGGGGVSPHRYPGTDNGAAKEAEGEGPRVGQRSDFGEAHLGAAQQGHPGGTPQPLPPGICPGPCGLPEPGIPFPQP